MLKALKKYKFWFFLAILFLILRIPSLFEPYWYGDEGIYLTLGQAIRKGITLYKNIHDNKPPTLYYLAAISYTVFGFRLLLMAVMAPTIYFFNRLSRLFLSDKISKIATVIFLVLTSIPFFEGNIANAEVFMLLPTILGIYFFYQEESNLSIKTVLFSGFLLGLAFTLKIPVLFEFTFLCVWILIVKSDSFKKILPNLRNLLFFIFAFFVPILFWAIFYYLQGALKPFIFSSLLQNIGYLSSWSTGSHSSSVGSGGLITRFIFLLIFWIIVFLLKTKKIINSQFSFLLFWFSSTIFGALLSGRPYPHYLIQTLPPLVLIISECINFRNKKNQLFSLFLVLSFSLILYKFKFYHYPTINYYSNFYSYVLGVKNKTDYQSYFGNQVNNFYKISSYIDKNTTPKDKIFVWGDQPYIYALSNRLPSSKYTVAYHIADFNGYQNTINKIQAYLPKFIIYYQMSGRPFADLDSIIKNYYYTANIIGDATIYQLR